MTVFSLFVVLVYGQGRVSYVNDGNGTITLRVTAYGKKSKNAIENAEIEAIKTILFRGIPESTQCKNPLISTNENDIIKNNKDYFVDFFDRKRCRSFIISNVPVSKFSKDATNKKCITVDIKVNFKSIRSDLENHNIIRKFGF